MYFCKVECRLVSEERMMEVENREWASNLADTSVMNRVVYTVSKYLFPSYVLIMKGK